MCSCRHAEVNARRRGERGECVTDKYVRTKERTRDITGAAHGRLLVCTISRNVFIRDHLGVVPNTVRFRSREREKKYIYFRQHETRKSGSCSNQTSKHFKVKKKG